MLEECFFFLKADDIHWFLEVKRGGAKSDVEEFLILGQQCPLEHPGEN